MLAGVVCRVEDRVLPGLQEGRPQSYVGGGSAVEAHGFCLYPAILFELCEKTLHLMP